MLNFVLLRGENGKAGIWPQKSAPRYESREQWQAVSRNLFGCNDADSFTLSGVACPDAPHGGVWFSEDLAGVSGMAFTLFREVGKHTTSDLAEAKRFLRNRRDVVAFYTHDVSWTSSHAESQDHAVENHGVSG